jgi:hypothetical protein
VLTGLVARISPALGRASLADTRDLGEVVAALAGAAR